MTNLLSSLPEPYNRPQVAGVVFGTLFIIGSIILGSHSLLAFFSIEGLVIVVGGVIVTAFMSFESEDVRKALDTIKSMFKEQEENSVDDDLHRDMKAIVAWATIAREKGMRTLETLVGKNGISDPYVKYGLNMVVSGYSPDDVRMMMETAADACDERDYAPVDVLQSMASHAPAFGMIGTLVGMVAMLCNLNGDMSGVGSSLSVSFLSTLYGVVSARMIYMPAAAKLKQAIARRRFRHHLISEGMAMLTSDKAPMYIQDRLNSFLKPESHDYFDYFKVKPAAVTGAAPRPILSQPLKAANA